MKKCSKCPQPATLHITELIENVPRQLHLCEECAKRAVAVAVARFDLLDVLEVSSGLPPEFVEYEAVALENQSRGCLSPFHPMRHTFGTHLSKGGVAPRVAQAAMRHSSIDLTMNVYTRLVHVL